jgi:hypothetical protein
LGRVKEFLFLVLLGLIFLAQPYWCQELRSSVLLMIQGTFSPLEAGTREMLGSSQARLEQTRLVLPILKVHYWFGDPEGRSAFSTLDNRYLIIALEYGVPVLILTFAYYAMQLKLAISLWRHSVSRTGKIIGVLMTCTTVGLLIVWGTVGLQSYMYLFWIYIALLARMYCNEKGSGRGFTAVNIRTMSK